MSVAPTGQVLIDTCGWVDFLRGKGFRIPLTDALIAAVAIRHNLRVLTVDKHFARLGVTLAARERPQPWLRQAPPEGVRENLGAARRVLMS